MDLVSFYIIIENLLVEKSVGVINALSCKQVTSLIQIFEENPEIANPKFFIKISENISKIYLFLKSLKDFLLRKLSNSNLYLHEVKKQIQRKVKFLKLVQILKTKLT